MSLDKHQGRQQDHNAIRKHSIQTKFDVSRYGCHLLALKSMKGSFDSDSLPMGIDTCTTATLSGCRVGEIQPISHVTLRGVGGTLPVVGRGTFVFNFLDDHGNEQQLKVEDAYYVPRLKLCLLAHNNGLGRVRSIVTECTSVEKRLMETP